MVDMDNISKIGDWRIRKALTELAKAASKPAAPKFPKVAAAALKPKKKKK